MKKHSILFVLLIFWVTIIFCTSETGILSGKVMDTKGSPIAYANVMLKGTSFGTITDEKGKFLIKNIPPGNYVVSCFLMGYTTSDIENVHITINETKTLNITLKKNTLEGSAIIVKDQESVINKAATGSERSYSSDAPAIAISNNNNSSKNYQYWQDSNDQNFENNGYHIDHSMRPHHYFYYPPRYNTEEYKAINPYPFYYAFNDPVSTFSIDVDNATYSNLRRLLNYDQLPRFDVVRIEEMINYFKYNYPEPLKKDPVSISSELGKCLWNENHDIVKIGIKGKELKDNELLPANLVFLIDVSGSMQGHNKLPLVKQSLKKLVQQLNPQDRVSIVTYASQVGVKLESTPITERNRILQAIDELYSGGSTAGGQGLVLAYDQAMKGFNKNNNNRILLCTDGDFNVGLQSDKSMEELVTQYRTTGVFISVLGFGMGNYKDSKMEIIADKGNGNYYYIDDLIEANRVLVSELKGTLNTIAKDVKIQVEFNPAKVRAYRLIGYENRALKNEDFKNDLVDAGEIGSGQTVTVLYEIVKNNSKETDLNASELKYQTKKYSPEAVNSNELFTLKLRYKEPNGDKSIEMNHIVKDVYKNPNTKDFNFACSVAGFGMLLQKSKFREDLSYETIIKLAQNSLGEDNDGYRKEFISLLEKAKSLDHNTPINE